MECRCRIQDVCDCILTIGDSYRATTDGEESYLLNNTDRMTL